MNARRPPTDMQANSCRKASPCGSPSTSWWPAYAGKRAQDPSETKPVNADPVGSAMVAAVMYPRYAAGPIVESRRENATESLLRS
jgi:hypothetical protein